MEESSLISDKTGTKININPGLTYWALNNSA